MAWRDLKTGQRYTDKELSTLEAAPVEQDTPQPESPEHGTMANLGLGAVASIKRTYLGLKQLASLAGNDEDRAKINDEIKAMEEEYAPVLGTTAGKVGEFAGTMGQMLIPGGAAGRAASMAPRILPRTALRTMRNLAPGPVLRGTAAGGTFEAAQPVLPPDTSTESLLIDKAERTAIGAGAGGAAGKVGQLLTRTGPVVAPERAALASEAERLGLNLTPAQRTGDVTLQQLEEGLASRPGSSSVIHAEREAQREALDRAAAKAIGSPAPAPTEAVIAQARESANRAYDAMAGIPKMSWDTDYIKDLDRFIGAQAKKVTGSPDAANLAKKLKQASAKWSGDTFLEELQGIRDLAFAASRRHDVATSRQLRDLSTIMEDFAERRVQKLAAQGQIAPDAFQKLKDARIEHAKLYAIEKATEPTTGRVSPSKFLTGEKKRQPSSTKRGASATGKGLQEVGDIARVLRQTGPYIGSSGTAERLAGQQMAQGFQGPLSAWRAGIPMAKNYAAARAYLSHGGKPSYLGTRLTPAQSAYVRRMLPPAVIAAGEAEQE